MRGEDDGDAGAARGQAAEVDLAFAEAKCIGNGRLALPANGSLPAGRELPWAEGLGNVVVCAEFEKEHLVDNFADGAEDNNGRFVGEVLEGLTEFAAGDARENEVENNGNGVLGPEEIETRLAIARDGDGVVFVREDSAEHLLHPRVIFDHENCAEVYLRGRIHLAINVSHIGARHNGPDLPRSYSVRLGREELAQSLTNDNQVTI